MRFMAHVYCGDPTISFSEKLIKALDKGGMDVLELGIPFSDPIADGRVFQQACQRALAQGVTPGDVFMLVRKLRKEWFKKPVILTTYYNIIFKRGIKRFVEEVVECRIQGIIVPDLPFEESEELRKECRKNKVDLIYLITPVTKDEKMKKIVEVASGFVYVVSFAGVTGTRKDAAVNEVVGKIKKISDIPTYVGFGISKPEDVRKLPKVDGFIIGSEIARLYLQDGSEAEKLDRVKRFAKEIKKA